MQDLHYGDVLLPLTTSTKRLTSALTRLLGLQHWERMPHHEQDAQLLAGGLYLELGHAQRGGRALRELLDDDVPAGVRNKAWFYLAKIWYERGYMDKAEQALRKINGSCPRSSRPSASICWSTC